MDGIKKFWNKNADWILVLVAVLNVWGGLTAVTQLDMSHAIIGFSMASIILGYSLGRTDERRKR